VTAGAVGSVWGEGRRLPRGLWPKGCRCREGRVPVRGGNRRHCTRRPEPWREQIAVQITRGGGDGGTGGSGPSDGDTEGRQRAAPSNSKGEGRGKRSTCRRVRGSGGAGVVKRSESQNMGTNSGGGEGLGRAEGAGRWWGREAPNEGAIPPFGRVSGPRRVRAPKARGMGPQRTAHAQTECGGHGRKGVSKGEGGLGWRHACVTARAIRARGQTGEMHHIIHTQKKPGSSPVWS